MRNIEKKSNKKQNNKIKFIAEYEPSLPNIYDIWRKNNHLLKNVNEWLVNTNTNTKDLSNIVSHGCFDCGKNLIFCKYLKEKGKYFF